jgi:selenocysteine-specific elongation factor
MDKLIIAMNKVDMFPNGGVNDPTLQANTKKLRARFKHTRFGAFLPIVHVSAAPRSGDGNILEPYGVENLINSILEMIDIPNREVAKKQNFKFAIDHCFQIKGQGTVMTGTVLGGQVKIGDNIELPNLRVEKKVKSMQMFRKPVQVAKQGDRVGICVSQLDAS